MAGNDQTEIVGGRSLIFYDAPYATSVAMPADSAWGTAWGAPFVNRGYTRDGLRVQWRRQFVDWDVDQEVVPVLRTPDTFDMRFQANLAQFDVTALKATTQQGATSIVAAASGTRGHSDYAVSGDVTVGFVSIGFDVQNPGDGEAIRSLGYKTIPMGDVSFGFTPRPPGAQIPYEGALIPDTTTSPSRVALIRDIIPALP